MSPAMTVQPTTDCCGGATQRCASERTRFFAGQLITPADLTQDQDYFRERMRRHNRIMHGWGIVCGATVIKGRGPCEVIISAGFILGPQGDEILIEKELTINLCLTDPEGDVPSDCGPPVDPWCSDVRVRRNADATLYIAVRYAESPTRPVRSSGCGCGCNQGDCEYSRIRDGFVIRALTELPSSYNSMAPPNIAVASSCAGAAPRACLQCPSDPWVILAEAKIGGDGASLASVNQPPHRRYAVSFMSNFFVCP
jgi:hypothetical protein